MTLKFLASNDDLHEFEHWFHNISFLNETDPRLEAQKKNFGVESKLNLENFTESYQFHVDVGMDSNYSITRFERGRNIRYYTQTYTV